MLATLAALNFFHGILIGSRGKIAGRGGANIGQFRGPVPDRRRGIMTAWPAPTTPS